MDAISTSKTHQFYLLLKERITSGALQPGHRLPSEPRLAAAHRLSRITIRRALDGLARDGLISRKPGTGTFVRDTAVASAVVSDLSNMLVHLAAMGRATRVKLLAFSYGAPPPSIAEALKLGPGEATQHALRVRYLDGTPFSYLATHVPQAIGRTYARKDLAVTPLLKLLERSGVVASTACQTISATLAGPEAAAALNVAIGSPLLSLVRIVLDRDGNGIEHLTALYRPDMHAFRMEMLRTGQGRDRHWRPTIDTDVKPIGRRSATSGRRRA